MARTQTMVQLTDDLVRRLDDESARRGISRSALIREVLVEYLIGAARTSIGARIADGYRRIPPATPDEWGDLEAQADRATKELMQRMDEEEREAGLSW